jgi:hypothetical protein
MEGLLGLNCSPVAIKGTKLRLLRILSMGIKRRLISVQPDLPMPRLALDSASSTSD